MRAVMRSLTISLFTGLAIFIMGLLTAWASLDSSASAFERSENIALHHLSASISTIFDSWGWAEEDIRISLDFGNLKVSSLTLFNAPGLKFKRGSLNASFEFKDILLNSNITFNPTGFKKGQLWGKFAGKFFTLDSLASFSSRGFEKGKLGFSISLIRRMELNGTASLTSSFSLAKLDLALRYVHISDEYTLTSITYGNFTGFTYQEFKVDTKIADFNLSTISTIGRKGFSRGEIKLSTEIAFDSWTLNLSSNTMLLIDGFIEEQIYLGLALEGLDLGGLLSFSNKEGLKKAELSFRATVGRFNLDGYIFSASGFGEGSLAASIVLYGISLSGDLRFSFEGFEEGTLTAVMTIGKFTLDSTTTFDAAGFRGGEIRLGTSFKL